MADITVIGVDGDDTLWHSEGAFTKAQSQAAQLVNEWAQPEDFAAHMTAVERENISLYGYGAKGYALSLVEAAVAVSGGAIPSERIAELIELGKGLLNIPIDLCDHAAESMATLAEHYRLVLITKGDLLHQERKIAESGLAPYFWEIEVTSEKDPSDYDRILRRHGIDPAEFVMVGNSLRSDVLPVLEIGARAVHVPYEVTWALEHADTEDHHEYWEVDHLGDLPPLLS